LSQYVKASFFINPSKPASLARLYFYSRTGPTLSSSKPAYRGSEFDRLAEAREGRWASFFSLLTLGLFQKPPLLPLAYVDFAEAIGCRSCKASLCHGFLLRSLRPLRVPCRRRETSLLRLLDRLQRCLFSFACPSMAH